MQTRELDKTVWRSYFDAMSRHLPATLVEIEVAGLDLGDQIQVEWVPLLGISYDAADDSLEIATESLGHRIRQPAAIHVAERDGRLHLVRIEDADGREQVVRLRLPLRITG